MGALVDRQWHPTKVAPIWIAMVERSSCPECGIGSLRMERSYYFAIIDGNPLCIPSFPAWSCDIYKYQAYDFRSLIELGTLLHSIASGSSSMHSGEMKSGLETNLPSMEP